MSILQKEALLRNANAAVELPSQSLRFPYALSRPRNTGSEAFWNNPALSVHPFLFSQPNLALSSSQQANGGSNASLPYLSVLSAHHSSGVTEGMLMNRIHPQKRDCSKSFDDIKQRVDTMASKRARLN